MASKNSSGKKALKIVIAFLFIIGMVYADENTSADADVNGEEASEKKYEFPEKNW
jgi:hypothetical protein